MVESKELENILTQKDVFMKVDLMIIILMVKEYLNGEMEEFIKVIGSMEECMDMEFIFGLMETVMKVIIMKARKMVQENLLGQMVDIIKANGKTDKNMEKV